MHSHEPPIQHLHCVTVPTVYPEVQLLTEGLTEWLDNVYTE